MRFAKPLVAVLVFSVLGIDASLQAQDVTSLFPQETLGYVVINDLTKTSTKIEGVARKVRAPLPNPLAFFKATAGIQEGLDENGTVALAYCAADGDVEAGYPIAFLPVTDYKAFVSQFGAQEPDAKIIEVPVAGAPVLIGRKGNFALFAEPKHKDALTKLLDRESKPLPEIAAMSGWQAKNNVAVVVTSYGVKTLTNRGNKELNKVKEEFGTETEDPAMAQVVQVFELYSSVLDFLGREVSAGGAGVWVSEEGDIHLTSRAAFVPTSKTLDVIANIKPATKNPLAGLTAGPYVLALGGEASGFVTDAMIDWSVAMIKANPAIYGFKEITDEQARKLAVASTGMSKQIKTMAFKMGPGKGQDPLYGTMTMVYSVENAETFIKEYRSSLKVWNDLIAKLDNEKIMKMEVSDLKIEGQSGLEITMDITGIAGAQGIPGGPDMNDLFEKMFGEGGKMRIYMAPTDEKTVFIAYTSKDVLIRAMQAHKAGDASLATDEGIQTTAGKMPNNVTMAGYVSPAGVINMVNRAINLFAGPVIQLPEFPATPPLGTALMFDKQGCETDCVLPSETLGACVEYAMKVEQMFNGGF